MVFDPRKFCSYGWGSSAGSTISQPLVNPPQVPQVLQAPQAPQAMNPPARAAGQIASAPQFVQVNVANAQDELEGNFGISVSLSILDFLVVSLFWSHITGLVMIYVAYQLQFSMGVLCLFALLFQWRSCISRAGFFFPEG